MLNLPTELRCMIMSYLDIPSLCRLQETCKWFSQDVLWDIYLKTMHTKSKCLYDHESSPKDKIKYLYRTRDVPLAKIRPNDSVCTLYEVNDYEWRHNIQLPLYVKVHLIETSSDLNNEDVFDLSATPVIKSDGSFQIKLKDTDDYITKFMYVKEGLCCFTT